jgi:transposase
MGQCIGCDAHKKFSVFVSIDEGGQYATGVRVGHDRERFRKYLKTLEPGSDIALETGGCYYWMVDEIAAAGHHPHLAHALTVKWRTQGRHKTNARDAGGLAMLMHNGTLPEVWIPPAGHRDQRELLRLRMTLSHQRSRVKNRVHGVLQQYNLHVAASDLFGDQGRVELLSRQNELPEYSRLSVLRQIELVDHLDTKIKECESLIQVMLAPSAERELLDSLPCVGKILSAVMAMEIGDVGRFPGPNRLASYCGLVPVAIESADWKRKGRCPQACNNYLKWAYVEAANLISAHRHRWPERHVVRLFDRVKQRSRMHGKAAMAVARHLAEASYWMLSRHEVYQEPRSKRPALSSTHG